MQLSRSNIYGSGSIFGSGNGIDINIDDSNIGAVAFLTSVVVVLVGVRGAVYVGSCYIMAFIPVCKHSQVGTGF